jgi:hypothetical protein
MSYSLPAKPPVLPSPGAARKSTPRIGAKRRLMVPKSPSEFRRLRERFFALLNDYTALDARLTGLMTQLQALAPV